MRKPCVAIDHVIRTVLHRTKLDFRECLLAEAQGTSAHSYTPLQRDGSRAETLSPPLRRNRPPCPFLPPRPHNTPRPGCRVLWRPSGVPVGHVPPSPDRGRSFCSADLAPEPIPPLWSRCAANDP